MLLRAPREWEIVAVYHGRQASKRSSREHGLTHVAPVRVRPDRATRDVRALARAIGGRADAALYLAANGDPAAVGRAAARGTSSRTRWRWSRSSNTARSAIVVYVSSGAVYDGLRRRGVAGRRRSTAAAVRDLEARVRALPARFSPSARHAVGSYVNVRFFGAYGPYEPARKITTRWLRAHAAGQREFTLRGNGENLIDFMYVDDAVDGLLRAGAGARARAATVDFASGAPVSVNDVVRTMARVLGVDVTIRHEGATEEYIQFHSVDRDDARSVRLRADDLVRRRPAPADGVLRAGEACVKPPA